MKKTIFILLGLLYGCFLYAQPTARLSFGPYLQAVGEHEFSVVFGTDTEAIAWVEVAPDDGSNFYAEARPRYYQTAHGRRTFGRLHCIRVEGLESGKTYRYRPYVQAVLKDEGNKRMILGDAWGCPVKQKQKYRVTTLNPEKSEIRFSMFNDIHGRDSVLRQLSASLSGTSTDFVLLNGDMTTQIENEEEIRSGYLQAISACFAYQVPVFSVRGNHDLRGSYSYRYPEYFPNHTPHTYYTFRHGPAFFILLDSGEDKPDSDIRYYGLADFDRFRENEARWLEEVVRSPEFKAAPIRIVVMHMPPDPEGWHGAREVERLFMPVLNAAGIDLMLCGHLHRIKTIPAGTQGNQFPIVINSNNARMDVVVRPDEIRINGLSLPKYVEKTGLAALINGK